MQLSYFRRDGEALVPTDIARSMWSDNQMHGVAISGGLARALEQQVRRDGTDGLVPSRLTVDLFKPATMEPCTFKAETVRSGRRICLVDALLLQGGERVARASGVFLLPTQDPDGRVWEPEDRPAPPPSDVVPPSDEPRVPWFHSSAGWSQRFGDHQNASRKASWNATLPVVDDEPATPFQAVASTADGASLVTNWGTGGIEHINTDITLALVRQPAGLEIGLAAIDRVEADGIAVGAAAVFDREGPLGNVIVTSLANTRRTVDMGAIEYTDDGRRRRGR
jgi:hypothetical protein